jgi:hypothetical protein
MKLLAKGARQHIVSRRSLEGPVSGRKILYSTNLNFIVQTILSGKKSPRKSG